MNYIRKKQLYKTAMYSIPIILGLSFFSAHEAKAKTITVDTKDEFDDAVEEITEDTTIKLSDTFEFNGLEGPLVMEIDTPYEFTFDANSINLVGHIYYNHGGTGKTTFENLKMNATNASEEAGTINLYVYNQENSGDFILKNSTFEGVKNSPALGMNSHGNHMYLENVQFKKIQDAPALYLTGETFNMNFNNVKFNDIEGDSLSALDISASQSTVSLENTEFKNNTGGLGGGIYASGDGLSITMNNSSFINNKASGPYGGAFTTEYALKDLIINNTLFKNNTADASSNSFQAAGAISIDSPHDDLNLQVNSSIFDGNKVVGAMEEGTVNGGAISIPRFMENAKINIKGTTFENNQAYGGGGALAVNAQHYEDRSILVENSTFYKNSAIAKTDEDTLNNGGAILIRTDRNLDPEDEENEETIYDSKNNTFYDNKIVAAGGNESKGGALAVVDYDGYVNLTNDLLVGNHVEPSNALFSNLFISTKKLKNVKSLGVDNGVATKDTAAQVYGKFPVTLAANNGKIKAGATGDAQVIPTLLIAPNLSSTVGIANRTGDDVLEKDQRGYERLGKSDVGAVEIATVLYEPNGGKFTLPELTKYDGKTYYEGTNPTKYANVGYPGEKMTIIDGKKVMKPTKTNSEFLGWSTNKGAKLPDATHAIGKKVVVDDQLVLYAVWKEKKYNVNYYGNGNTTGVEPTQKAVATNTKVTVKKVGTLKKKGYKFAGWSSKATSRKADAKLAPGKKVTVTKKTQFYAVWKR